MESFLKTTTTEATKVVPSPIFEAVGDVSKLTSNRLIVDEATRSRHDWSTESQEITHNIGGYLMKTPTFINSITRVIERRSSIAVMN